jgi:hypothetical protein
MDEHAAFFVLSIILGAGIDQMVQTWSGAIPDLLQVGAVDLVIAPPPILQGVAIRILRARGAQYHRASGGTR